MAGAARGACRVEKRGRESFLHRSCSRFVKGAGLRWSWRQGSANGQWRDPGMTVTRAGLRRKDSRPLFPRLYTRPVPNGTRETLRAVMRQKVPPGATLSSDQLSSDDGRITQGSRHYWINHGEGFARSRRQHINGIENFRGDAKTQLTRDAGIPRNHFWLSRTAMACRFPHRHDELPLLIRRIVKTAKPVLDWLHCVLSLTVTGRAPTSRLGALAIISTRRFSAQ